MEDTASTAICHGRLLQVAQYIKHLRGSAVKGSSIATYISEIRANHALETGFTYMNSPLLRRYLLRLDQYDAVANPDALRPIKLPVTKAIIAHILSDASEQLGTRLACLLAFDGMLRAHEYVSKSTTQVDARFTLLRRDIEWSPHHDAFFMRIKASKSDPSFSGPQILYHRRPGDAGCPVALLSQYLQWFDSRFSPDSPLFRRDDGSFTVRADIDQIIKRHASASNLPADQISTHGLRVGGAFALAEDDVLHNRPIDWATIIARGRWSGISAERMAQQYARFSLLRSQRVSERLRISDCHSATPILRRH